MSPKWRVRGAWALLILCLINIPLSLFVYAKDEPVTILLLSWGAMILTCIDILSTTDVRKQQEGE